MDNNQKFRFIKGECRSGEPADICFYTDVDYWSVDSFLWEFDYLVNYVNPSKIRIHINSVGGSVVDGMSVFAKIQNCTIPTECINDALAASMGSIIWAAGDELYMKDYALLMIHNPFCDRDGKSEYNQATEAFAKQLKTIYVKRFGLSEDEVEDIMNGKEGEDGTFLTASEAVEKGFISSDRIIETPAAIRNSLRAMMPQDLKDVTRLQCAFSLAVPQMPECTINKQNTNTNKMEENKISVFAALVGLTGDKATPENVTAKITEINAKAEKAAALQTELDKVKSELTTVKAELTGSQTSVKNLTEDLDKTKAALKIYQDAEEEAKTAKVNALIDQAIKDCKINKDEREDYLKMAQDNYDLAEKVLAKIPARDNLGKVLGEDGTNDAKKGMKTAEQQVIDKVNAVVGNDFEFRKLQ